MVTMSYGIVVCSKCRREVHQNGGMECGMGWTHCTGSSAAPGSPICKGAKAVYPSSTEEIVGAYCGADGMGDVDVNKARHKR